MPKRRFAMQEWVAVAGVNGGEDVPQSAIVVPQIDSCDKMTVRTLLGAFTYDGSGTSPKVHIEGANWLGDDWESLVSYDSGEANTTQALELTRSEGAAAGSFLYRFLRWRVEKGTGSTPDWDVCFAIELDYD